MAAKLQPFTALRERRQAAAGRLFASGQVVLSLNSNFAANAPSSGFFP